MEKELRLDLDELRAALKNDPRVKKLDEIEASLSQDAVLIELVKKKNAAEEAYDSILSYRKETDPEALSLQKSLYLAKKTLDDYPLVKDYNEAFIAVRDLYMSIDDALFGPYRSKVLFEGVA
jgi:cell fate (sporulation/competence/biofilm development) regulator YmcA (YheA/YmcA/DUF963 family)